MQLSLFDQVTDTNVRNLNPLQPHRRTGLKLLDLFCCQGGATRGYQLAGFNVTGVDLHPQPRYCGDNFHQADAIAFLRSNMDWIRREFVAVSASPPCQRFTNAQRIQAREHPDLIEPTRALLIELGLPYVIENVEGAPLRKPITLCGTNFGLRTYRHRLFELGNGFEIAPLPHAPHGQPTVKMGRPLVTGDFYHAVGNFSNVDYVRRDMGMAWASREGIREAVPPAYTAHLGAALLDHIHAVAA
ncbi:DNA (cytosine-5)-methyltransferase 1 [Lentzea atacamensis]|uniref:DNA (Cytosine-5)-methyltransferase 1 n=1 Tax=Lentzea atacamensis TaxID=531938 RepID=A0A316I9U1_9PSEU|nr:DNA cytosine methyltransferase [Lentzea atacamensis]PWK90302.1 DNA (cytosine-5)-methyltransferase 1 [Lentzea atacamensis]